MLPFEIYIVAFLYTTVSANPQIQKSNEGNSTQLAAPPATQPAKARPTSIDKIRIELTVSGFPVETTLPTTFNIPKVGVTETPETGFEIVTREQNTPPVIIPRPPAPDIVTTQIPTVIGIQTQYSVGRPPPTSQPSATSGILDEIISRIGDPAPTARASNGPNGGNQDITEPSMPATVPVNDRITLGPATLNLTPGLSTTIGTGTAATIVAMTTNDAGQTIIVVSSSGTAISATVVKTAITFTAPRSGFDAILTDAAKPANGFSRAGDGSGTATTTTASKGLTSRQLSRRTEWWTGLLVGIGVII